MGPLFDIAIGAASVALRKGSRKIRLGSRALAQSCPSSFSTIVHCQLAMWC